MGTLRVQGRIGSGSGSSVYVGEGGGKGLTCTNLSRAQNDAMKDASIEATSYLLLLWSAPFAHRIECRLVSSFFFGFLHVTYVWSVTSGGGTNW